MRDEGVLAKWKSYKVFKILRFSFHDEVLSSQPTTMPSSVVIDDIVNFKITA